MNQKGISLILMTLIVIGILIVCEGGYYFYQKSQNTSGSTGKQTKCAQEGEFTSGGKLSYYYGCCQGLKEFDTCLSCPPDKNYLCFNSSRGIPECKMAGTESEGWYYSGSGSLLTHGKCSN
jgi:hypothetical protein